MGSTSAGIDGVDAMLENSNFAFRRNGLLVYENLEALESNEPPPPTAPTDLFQIQPENEQPAEIVPMQLLNLDEQERADLLLVCPKAKVEGTCITAFHFSFVVKLFLYMLKVSNNCFEEVPHPRAIARLLCRLRRELRSALSFESVALADEFSDPTDYDGCLGEMLNDMKDYVKTADTASSPDGYVYVRRETDTYEQSLFAAANALNAAAS